MRPPTDAASGPWLRCTPNGGVCSQSIGIGRKTGTKVALDPSRITSAPPHATVNSIVYCRCNSFGGSHWQSAHVFICAKSCRINQQRFHGHEGCLGPQPHHLCPIMWFRGFGFRGQGFGFRKHLCPPRSHHQDVPNLVSAQCPAVSRNHFHRDERGLGSQPHHLPTRNHQLHSLLQIQKLWPRSFPAAHVFICSKAYAVSTNNASAWTVRAPASSA